ncbi:hypothetical protein GCM10023334_037800 [Nonomuraea thailandensis]
MDLRALEDDGDEHPAHHATWAIGLRPPKNLEWWGDLAVVTTESPIAWRKLAHQMGVDRTSAGGSTRSDPARSSRAGR